MATLPFKRICVFCGSRHGARPDYAAAAEALGRTLAADGIELVYGGGNVGLMGVVADACLAAGGSVTGVIPQALKDWEVAHEGLTRLEVVDSMHTRKARMAELADGFIALPGGLGTFEELFEILTWAQLGFHRKPVALLDVAGYYAPMRQMMAAGVSEGFMKPQNAERLLIEASIPALLRAMAAYVAPHTDARIDNTDQL
ncbi:TIGR00730 family Rossman fold protein [Nitrogeniibacter mangrovi]|uniref:Cytokinin riboside 5'-monophosphate phosphoribohydrolase n=1 Tax=Nitrogeniibacter mangrovi TaxID=2016596 RepID=A0A6C1AYX1_9RHOO|nr:TIGR00730 family Rossman fold protein [Nitrogeniibacter mangrovi]QID16556.1 TIGR00730 family Rossman fold protein [Nitrogeniibacter mangrovi]